MIAGLAGLVLRCAFSHSVDEPSTDASRSSLAMAPLASSAQTARCRIEQATTEALKNVYYLFLDITKELCGKKWEGCRPGE